MRFSHDLSRLLLGPLALYFEVYPSLAKATDRANKIATSQMALPEATCQAVYATSGYEQSLSNMSRVSLDTDNVFRDGYDLQIPP